MQKTIYLNGRFLTQRVTGVQRYALEIVGALDELVGALPNNENSFILLVPKAVKHIKFKHIKIKKVGWGFSGHLWEQLILPLYVMHSMLVSLCNTGPIFKSNQTIVLYDASVLDHPEWFKKSFVVWYKFLWKWLTKTVKNIVTISEFSKQRLAELLNLNPDRVQVLYAAVSPLFTRASNVQIEAVRAFYQISGPYFIFVGSLEPRKNLAGILKAWDLVKDKLHNHKLVIVGARGRVFKKINISEWSDQVVFLDKVSDEHLVSLMSGALALVYPSFYEGFGLPPLEAMAVGTPVIVSDTTSLPEVVGKDNAFFVNPRDYSAIGAGFMFFANNPTHVELFRQKGLDRVRFFSWHKSAKVLLELIKEDF